MLYLQVGTLDQLVGLTDDLAKLDAYVEGIIRKLVTYMEEILEDQKDVLKENLNVNNGMNYLPRKKLIC